MELAINAAAQVLDLGYWEEVGHRAIAKSEKGRFDGEEE